MPKVNKKVSNLYQLKIDTALYQAFVSLNLDTEIIQDQAKICPELCKSVKVFKNNNSLLVCYSESQVI